MLALQESTQLDFAGGGGPMDLVAIMDDVLAAAPGFGLFFLDDASVDVVDGRCSATMSSLAAPTVEAAPRAGEEEEEEERLRRIRQLRRMASNRESARRSRARKRRREEELGLALEALRAENRALAVRLDAASRRALAVAVDGARLRAEARALRRRLGEAQGGALALLGMSRLLAAGGAARVASLMSSAQLAKPEAMAME